MTRNRTAIFIILLLTTVLGGRQAFGQKRIVTQNLQNFDLRPLHFGFLLGYNTSDFFLKLKPNAPFTDSIQVVDHIRQPGFNLGIVTSFNMTPNLSLRFIPTLSFQDRVLSYRFKKSDGKTITFDKPVESTWLEFPGAVENAERSHQQFRGVCDRRRKIQHRYGQPEGREPGAR
ncbi:MAG: hypothetical protein IPO90_15770 [Flavobacteriales bacterium]|nr:hypothetical protein [Flavobacteriales bacterium]